MQPVSSFFFFFPIQRPNRSMIARSLVAVNETDEKILSPSDRILTHAEG